MPLDIDTIEEGLNLLSQGKNLPLMPNIPLPTLGGLVFWNDLAEVNGWRVQQNIITGHCRVLDEDNIRRAWGGEEAIMDFFNKVVKN
jgi:hypothetical protein